MTRKQRMWAKWTEEIERVARSIADCNTPGAAEACLGIREPWDRKYFREWLATEFEPAWERFRSNSSRFDRNPEQRRSNAIHELGHAVVSEASIPGSVLAARCFRTAQPFTAEDARGQAPNLSDFTQYISGIVAYNQEVLGKIDFVNEYTFVTYRLATAMGGEINQRLHDCAVVDGVRGDRMVLDIVSEILSDRREQQKSFGVASETATTILRSRQVREAMPQLIDKILETESLSGAEVREAIGRVQVSLKIVNPRS